MKTVISILLCLIIVCFCSCGNNRNNELTTALSTENNGVQQSMVSDKTQSVTEYVTIEIIADPNDPYSYLIKDKYDKFVEEYGENGKRSIQHYCLCDIDGNGIEELLIGTPYVVGGIDNVVPPYEYKIMIKEIYTLQNGDVIELSAVSWWDEMFAYDKEILDNGLIKYSSVFEGEYDYFYWRIDDVGMAFRELSLDEGKYMYRHLDGEMIEEINSNKTGINLEMELYFKAKEKEITSEEFERLRAEIEGDAKPVEIEWKNIDQYGR